MAGTDGPRIRVKKPIQRERPRPDLVLPIDPRDPDVARAKRTKQRSGR